MSRLHSLRTALLAVLLLGVSGVPAAIIERDVQITLGPTFGTFGDGQILGGIGTSFDAITFGLGDTLIFNLLFDQQLNVFDTGASGSEAFSFAAQSAAGSPAFNGSWVSSIEALYADGDIWSGSITQGFSGNGGIAWGGIGLPVTDSQGSFAGIRWTTQLTAVNTGNPLTLDSFTGVQLWADGITTTPVTPVPEPEIYAMMGIGLGIVGWVARRKRKHTG